MREFEEDRLKEKVEMFGPSSSLCGRNYRNRYTMCWGEWVWILGKNVFPAYSTGISTGHVPYKGAGLPDQQGI